MKRTINLHPNSNSGEASLATVSFENRVLSLEIESSVYGNSIHLTRINFDDFEKMIELANILVTAAIEARNEFSKNP
jgi:hypothetical protein